MWPTDQTRRGSTLAVVNHVEREVQRSSRRDQRQAHAELFCDLYTRALAASRA